MANDKQTQLDHIRADILEKNVCPELASQAQNLVMGDGNLNAEIVFIGEAPGKNEDEQGLPFVGAAGKFLNEMLAEAGMQRGDVYITNIVKYRPPNNRDPLPEEKKAFWPYLPKATANHTAESSHYAWSSQYGIFFARYEN
jgi:uracil-DNA glycosylase family 4